MSRVLLAMVFAVGLAGAANAAVMQFSVDGVPIPAGEVVTVMPSDWIVIDIWIDLNQDAVPPEIADTYVANVIPTGPWDPLPLDASGVAWVPPWGAGNQVYYPPDFYGAGMPVAGVFSDFITGDVGVDQAVAEFEVHIPDVPFSTILNLEFAPTDVFGDTQVSVAGVLLPLSVLPLELHVPEPATLGLLVLGGLAALRRRFA